MKDYSKAALSFSFALLIVAMFIAGTITAPEKPVTAPQPTQKRLKVTNCNGALYITDWHTGRVYKVHMK